ncbi:Spy/CpxP family protein refolding chaperone [Pleurocapsa sp. PCC 7319]|uniref:Spy/CpxP family protein refolding chaperone n=1 Tax=Pleurocapsa sp. PCC 7319 TaxID=118161 RepID=UPI0003480156|nr:Spy/CpxP family protein refolding chaperone [Pleurocapsa sp. PCC 7319]
MNWQTFSVLTATLVILPLGTYAAQPNPEVNSTQEFRTNSVQLAHNHGKHGRKWGRGAGMKKLFQQLDLTSEQSQQIEAIQEQFKTDNETLRQQMQTQHQEMRSLMASDATSEQLRAQHQQVQDLHQQLGNNRFETMLQVREVLTPEQRTQMAELMEQHQGKMGRHWQ